MKKTIIVLVLIMSLFTLSSCKSLKNFTKEDAYKLSLKRYKNDFKKFSNSSLSINDKNDLLMIKASDENNEFITIRNINGKNERPYLFNENKLTLPSGEEINIQLEDFITKYIGIKDNDILIDDISIDNYSYIIEEHFYSKGRRTYFSITSTYKVDNMLYNFYFLGKEYFIIVEEISFKFVENYINGYIDIKGKLNDESETSVRLSLDNGVF